MNQPDFGIIATNPTVFRNQANGFSPTTRTNYNQESYFMGDEKKINQFLKSSLQSSKFPEIEVCFQLIVERYKNP